MKRVVRPFLGLLLLALAGAAPATRPSVASLAVMPVERILEQRYRDEDLAVVVPERLELYCRSARSSPWNFAFAGFQTKWTGPLELEVTGSGDYTRQDEFSIAALSLDYATPQGWTERSLLGLGLIQAQRKPHPPTWGVGGDGKMVMRGNLATARPQGQRITVDPARYAPPGWDGRLWIGLMLHNTGTGRWLSMRVVNALPAGQAVIPDEPSEGAKWQMLVKHQWEYLREGLKELREKPHAAVPDTEVPAAMRPYAHAVADEGDSSGAAVAARIEAALKDEKHPPGSEGFLSMSDALGKAVAARPAGSGVAEQVNGIYRKWQEAGKAGEGLGCIIRVASNAEKVGLADLATGRVVGATPQPIQITAARREYEGFQLVLTPLAGSASDVRVAVSDLRGANGAIAASKNVQVNPVGYVRIFEGKAEERLVPDPLLVGQIPTLKPGENQPVWVTVHVPEGTPPGDYRGTVTVAKPDGSGALHIPLVLHVWDFEIPRRISLHSSFWMFRDQINRFYHLPEVPLEDYFRWIDLALQHRVNPIDVFEGRCEQLLPIVLDEKTRRPSKDLEGVPNPHPDFANWDRYLDRMLAGGANTLPLGQTHHEGAMFADKALRPAGSPQQLADVRKALAVLRDHYVQRGLMKYHYLQLRDETSEPASLNVYRDTRDKFPDLQLLLTAPSADARPLLTIPCPLTPSFDPAWRDDTHRKGGEYWWYVCVQPSDPRYANFFLQQTAAQHRALFWQTWANHVDGLLYWGMDFWSWYDKEYPQGTHGPTERVPARGEFNFCPLPEAPGDGFSMYPGPDVRTPLSSVRLECIRDGEEDYEYLVLLDKLIAERRGTPEALKRAEQARAAAQRLGASLTEYPHGGDAYLAVRQQVAEAIEGLIHGK